MTYGPYAEDGHISPQSNIAFHTNLKAEDPEHGLKDIKYLERVRRFFFKVNLGFITMKLNA